MGHVQRFVDAATRVVTTDGISNLICAGAVGSQPGVFEHVDVV